MKIVAIIQARMGSIRFKNKVIKKISGIPMIEIILNRLKKSNLIDEIVLATSKEKDNQILIKLVEDLGFKCFMGSEIDVLDRYVKAANKFDADI